MKASVISKRVCSPALLGIVCLACVCAAELGRGQELLPERLQRLTDQREQPTELSLKGDCEYGKLGDAQRELNGFGVRFDCGKDSNQDGKRAGEVELTAKIDSKQHRWYRLQICALAQTGFVVDDDDLWLNIDFFRDAGTNSLDHIRQRIYEHVESDRRTLDDKGRNRRLDEAVWRTFEMTFRTPYAEVDTLKLSVGYNSSNQKVSAGQTEFWISEISLKPISVPESYQSPTPPVPGRDKSEVDQLVSLGGRWYFDPRGGDKTLPEQFDHTNADRILYLTDRLETPFANNMSAWRRKGYLDLAGKTVQEDTFVASNMLISFTEQHLVIRSRNLPNHPTAVFPDRARSLDGNPNYIQERVTTTRIPLVPKENSSRFPMANGTNENGALPRGPIGIAVNGIVFFNPFDAMQNEDAIWRLDRCCGHPAPDYQYHYHKYPVCVKSPWADDGRGHSPLIGFASDGYPIYGPYESQGVMAKDLTDNPLNEFNVHSDEERGWHYHVTPGKFPHVIGGYWGIAETRRRSGPPGGGEPGMRPDGRRPPPPPPRRGERP